VGCANVQLELIEPGRASTSSTAVHFSWTAPYNGGSPILGYIVERKDSPTAAWSQLTTAASAYTSTSYVTWIEIFQTSKLKKGMSFLIE